MFSSCLSHRQSQRITRPADRVHICKAAADRFISARTCAKLPRLPPKRRTSPPDSQCVVKATLSARCNFPARINAAPCTTFVNIRVLLGPDMRQNNRCQNRSLYTHICKVRFNGTWVGYFCITFTQEPMPAFSFLRGTNYF
jgi:hypothetical protein